MGAEDDRSVVFDDVENVVPDETASLGVHSCRWFILQHGTILSVQYLVSLIMSPLMRLNSSDCVVLTLSVSNQLLRPSEKSPPLLL